MKRDPETNEYRQKSNEALIAGDREAAEYWGRKTRERWSRFLDENPDVARKIYNEEIEDEENRRILLDNIFSVK